MKKTNKKHLEELEKLFKEGKELGIEEIVKKAWRLGFNQGYDNAVERFEEEC